MKYFHEMSFLNFGSVNSQLQGINTFHLCLVKTFSLTQTLNFYPTANPCGNINVLILRMVKVEPCRSGLGLLFIIIYVFKFEKKKKKLLN